MAAPAVSTATLEARGSAVVSERKAAAKRLKLAEARGRYADRVIPSNKAIISPAKRSFGLLNGYDPERDAGDCYFDPKAARAAVRWMHTHLVHVMAEWAGDAFVLEPWQQAIVMQIYGWRRPDGTRRYREVFVYIPRKNGKTFLASALALHSFFVDREAAAQIFCAAAARHQAGELWAVSKQQVLMEKALLDDADVKAHAIIRRDDPLAVFRAISAEANTAHGSNPYMAVVDELWNQKDKRLVEALRTGMGVRRDPLIVYLTTADHMRESICNRLYDHACKVRDGVIDDPSFLPVIYEAGVSDDWTAEETWRKANPNYGVSVKPEFFRQEVAKAKHRPDEIDSFRRFYCNIRTNAETAAIDVRKWDQSGEEFDPAELRGCRAFGGLDLSKVKDLTSFALRFPEQKRSLVWSWIPRDTALEQQHGDRVPYLRWADEGWLELTPGDSVDYTFVRDRIMQILKDYDVAEVAFDPWNATQMVQELDPMGMKFKQFIQGPRSYNEGCQELERLVLKRDVGHGGNKLLRWCASNLMWRRDANNNRAPDKRKSSGRIDAVVALTMAVSLEVLDKSVTNPYAARGPIIV